MFRACSAWDHPRACGEELGDYKPQYGVWGSPPRVRGRGEGGSRMSGYDRITPARAGKSRPARSKARRKWDHPRACGEERPKSI